MKKINKIGQSPHILIDETIELKKDKTKGKYPKRLRHIAVYHEENHNAIEIKTNN